MSSPGRPRVDDVILDHALRLFYREGIRATGIDRILAEAGVAGMSVYRNFKSKDGLVAAVLKRRDEAWMSWLTAEVEIAPTPRERLLRVFDALDRWFRRDDFHGCMFINAAGEFADGASTARQAASGRRAHQRCSVLGWPWRMVFSRAAASLILSSGRATSMSLRGDLMG